MPIDQPPRGSNSFGLGTRSLAFFNEIQYITTLLVDLDGDPEEIDVNQ